MVPVDCCAHIRGLGALHALEPGHGKTIVAAYLVGSKGTARHAFLLGLIVTVAHTASVFVLGAITLYASRYILPEQLYPWLGLLSGLTIAALGGYMFLRRWTGEEVEHPHTAGEMHGHWFSSKKKQPAKMDPFAAPETTLPSGIAAAAPSSTGTVSLPQLFTLGITGGIIPCPAALVVLLSAFALHRINLGFFLITCFSMGLAAVLISFGLLMVYARRFMEPLADGWSVDQTVAPRRFRGLHDNPRSSYRDPSLCHDRYHGAQPVTAEGWPGPLHRRHRTCPRIRHSTDMITLSPFPPS